MPYIPTPTKIRCSHTVQDTGKRCKAWALHSPDPDGAFRCMGHSIQPAAVETRLLNGQRGRQSQTKDNRLRPSSPRRPSPPVPASSGVCEACGRGSDLGAVWPASLDLEQVSGPTGQVAWRSAVMRNLLAGEISEAEARTLAALLRDAGTAKAPQRGAGEEQDERSPAAVLRRLAGLSREEQASLLTED
jgi:hypothetical protein